MNSDAVQHRFSLIESIPPSADLHLAAQPAGSTARNQSPVRRHRFAPHEIDSFLEDLEPDLIFEALLASNNISPETAQGKGTKIQNRRDFIQQTVASASASEKVWGFKAAHAGQSIGEWYNELAKWPWPKQGQRNGFLAQYNEDALATSYPAAGPEAYRASIPSSQIGEYQMKVEGIKKYLGMLELEDLKTYVRDAHVTPTKKQTPQQSPAESASYDRIDDFTALITATIVQSLPKLARLTMLMNTWSVRLMIMRMVPVFMRNVNSCKDSMLSAQMAIGAHTSQTPTGTPGSTSTTRKSFSRNVFNDMQAVLGDQISETSKKLDAMLDLLEDSNDVLPDLWIDTMDDLESEHKTWAVKAEELVLDNELAISKISLAQGNNLAEVGNAARGSQLLQASARNARDLGSLGIQSDNGAKEVQSLEEPTLAGSHYIDQLSSNETTDLHPVRNVSNGVRKPTGIPGDNINVVQEQTAAAKPSPLVIERQVSAGESNATSDALSSVSRSESMDSDMLSAGSSPEIRSATFAAYPGSPVQVTTPSSSRMSIDNQSVSKQPESYDYNTRQSWSGTSLNPRPSASHQRKRSSTFTGSASQLPSHNSFLNAEHTTSKYTQNDTRPRSASVKSFEVISRSEVRTIEVRRSVGNASTTSLPRPDLVDSNSAGVSTWNRPQGLGNGFPGSSSETSLPGVTTAQDRFTSEEPRAESNQYPQQQSSKKGPEQISFAKTRSIFGRTTPSGDPTKKAAGQQRSTTLGSPATMHRVNARSAKTEDRLEARISSILTNIPANIRLTSAGEAAATGSTSTPVKESNAGKSTHTRRVSMPRLIRSRASAPTTPQMTLAPAPSSALSDSKSSSNPDVKLYHLHQPGTTTPIKLHIRLVGETGERVMVRVGGGWADLAEYLKEYASHHGKRAVSESYFNIHSLQPTSSPATGAATPASRPPTSSSSSTPFFRRQRTTSAAAVVGRAPEDLPPRTPPSGSGPLGFRPSSSRGTWSPASEIDSPSRGLGLAGPKTKNVNISPRKQAWVDGMMRQARVTSGSGGGGGESAGETRRAKVGGVKRVLLGMGSRKEGR